MKLNLGCGPDIRPGYVNVDLRPPCDQVVDLSRLPWPFADESADEILMLDFLEHFPYRQTGNILSEAWRVLRPEGIVEIQVPDFDICAAAATGKGFFQCNVCGSPGSREQIKCPKCGQHWSKTAQAAIERLYGGQDVEGNWHYTAFTGELLRNHMERAGFECFTWPERNQNGETYAQNWNIKVRARKSKDVWGDVG